MSQTPRWSRFGVALLMVAGWLPPAIAIWAVFGRAPAVTPEAARRILSDPHGGAVLVDVRTPEEFRDHHIEAARNWPYEQIALPGSARDVPRPLQGKRLLLICQDGIRSSLAARHLRRRGMSDAACVAGGMQTWSATANEPCLLELCRMRAGSGGLERVPTHPASMLEQGTAVVTAFAVKPLYTIFSLVLAVLLWRQTAPDLVALRGALLCFFLGENCCAANYLVFAERSVLFEYLHSYGMVLCFGLSTYALLEGVDTRLLKLSEVNARCAAMGLCGRCVKHGEVTCGLRRVFQFLIPALMLVALAPLCAELLPVSYNTTIFGSFYSYLHPVVHQIFEVRYLPVVACILLGASLALLRPAQADSMRWAKICFAGGVGAAGFSFFRLFLFSCYRDNLVWFTAWEEITEMLFILGVGLVLATFRGVLFSKPARRMPTA